MVRFALSVNVKYLLTSYRVWVTETGWPVSGANYGAAVASTKNAQTYWRAVGCSAFEQMHMFWVSHP